MKEAKIEQHGIIGNMRTSALVSIYGAIDFLCFPYVDSPSIFAELMDADRGGSFTIEPDIEELSTRQMYLPDTNILLTRFLWQDGVAELTDFMPVSEGSELTPYCNQIIRQLRVIHGTVRFRVRCAPRFDYGRAKHRVCREKDSVCFRPEGEGNPSVALYASVPMKAEGDDVTADFELKAGDTACFALGAVGEHEIDAAAFLNPDAITAEFNRTMHYWRTWMSKSKYSGHWRETVNRSALVLKLLTSIDHGSVAAAVTFGLPERPGGTRNWDYRYTWLRDSAFAMYAFMRMGFTEEARSFTKWMRERLIAGLESESSDGPLRIMYKMDGSRVDQEVSLDHLGGYQGSVPVRVGNSAVDQLQLDIYGAIFDAIYLSNKYVIGLSNDGWRRITRILEWLEANWNREDEGIWEVRNGRKHFLHSRLMSWVSFDRAIRLALKRSLVAPLERWYKVRDAIHEDILDNFWNEELGSFVQSKGSDHLDASALLMPMLRFISPSDPRWLSTMRCIEERLTEDVLVYRYGSGWDGLDGEEGSFTPCGFWRIECLARQGELEKARLLFEKMLGYANHLGLYSEQLGRTGEQLGNFPQALTHLALISAATYLDRKLTEKPGESTWE